MCIWRVTGILSGADFTMGEKIWRVADVLGNPHRIGSESTIGPGIWRAAVKLGWKSTDCIVQWVGQEYMEGGRYTRGAVAPLARHCPGLGN